MNSSDPMPISGASISLADGRVECADDGSVPLWLPSPAGHLFAWYHPPKGEVLRRRAVVLCNTFGSEAMLLHPAYRYCALALAEAGYPCLRFDYPGTNDSEGSPRDPQLLQRWLNSIHTAVDFLRQHSGRDQIGLFGVYLGASLAVRVASERDDIDSLILWAPYLSGKNFLRAAKMQASVITANVENRVSAQWQDGDTEAFGFLIAKEFAADLQKLDIRKIDRRPAPHACIFAKDSTSNEKSLLKTFTELGVECSYHAESISDITTIVDDMGIPYPLYQQCIDWLNGLADTEKSAPAKSAFSPAFDFCDQSCTIELRDGSRCIEEQVFYAAEPKLFGVLSKPPDSVAKKNLGIIMVNGGNNHRVGINRNYTEWARRWAALGYAALRFDIRGLGDSPPLPQCERNILYLDTTLDDLRESCKVLRERAGVSRVVVMGLCAGAYQSFRYALQSDDADALILLNPLRFQKPPVDVDGNVTGGSVRQLAASIPLLNYFAFFLNADNWADLKRWRRVSLSLVRNALKRCISVARRLSYVARESDGYSFSWRSEVADDFEKLAKRGARTLLVCSSTEVILPFLKVAMCRSKRRLQHSGYFRYCELNSTNHILAPLWSQEKVFDIMTDELKEMAEQAKAKELSE